MPYEIILSRKALKELAKLPTVYEEIIRAHIDALAENPRPFGYKQLKGEDFYFGFVWVTIGLCMIFKMMFCWFMLSEYAIEKMLMISQAPLRQ